VHVSESEDDDCDDLEDDDDGNINQGINMYIELMILHFINYINFQKHSIGQFIIGRIVLSSHQNIV